MPIECFKIEWTKSLPFNKALLQPEAKRRGVYALFKGNIKKPYYIGKARTFDNRLSIHKQSIFRMMSEAERKKCYISFGIVSSFKISHMTDAITDAELRSVESFLITRIQPIGNGDSTKKRYTGKLPMIIANTGSMFKGLQKFMSQNNDLLKVLGKATKRKSASYYEEDDLDFSF
jgi:hypothetical protein